MAGILHIFIISTLLLITYLMENFASLLQRRHCYCIN